MNRDKALAILDDKSMSWNDRLYKLCNSGLLNNKTMRLFSVWCARECLRDNADPCSVNAVNVAERYALGKATIEELDAAYSAARSAAYAAWSAARSAAWSAARSAAEGKQYNELRRMIMEGSTKKRFLSNQGTEPWF